MNMHVKALKVGDKVRALRDTTDVVAGKSYMISNVCDGGDVLVWDDVGDMNRLVAGSYEPAPLFAVGDKVRVVDNKDNGGRPIGKYTVGGTHTITKATTGSKGDAWLLDGHFQYLHSHQIEPILAYSSCAAAEVDNIADEYGAPKKATLRIEAGKFYKTRDGRKVGPASKTKWPSGEFVWSLGEMWLFKDDGTSGGEKHDNDLIAEWQDEPVAAPKFKVGDYVKSHTNSVTQYVVTRVDGDKLYTKARDASGYNYGPHDASMFYHDEPAPTTIADIVARHSQTGTAIVCVLENGQPAPATRPYVHTTASAAETEANRLARTNPGKEFGVYTLGTVAKVEKVYDHEWQRLAAGGQKINAIRELRGITGLGLATAKDAVEDWLRREAA